MKRPLLLLLVAVAALAASSLRAQNLQLHYDLGHTGKTFADRPRLTTTLEMFRPDKWGNTFCFVDMDYKHNGVVSAYWELAREFSLGKLPVNLHVEYNGGTSNRYSFNDAWLAGVSYAYNAPDFSKGFAITPMYKHLMGTSPRASWQITATWYYHFCRGMLSFTGFADCWNDRAHTDAHTLNIFLAEPQLWFNLDRLPGADKDLRLSLGGEVEISRNFVRQDGRLYAIPTLAAKWTF